MKRSVKILWRIFLFGFLAVVLLFVAANFGLFGKIPSMEDLQHPEADLASEIYTSDGKLMGKYYLENRSEVKYTELSPNIIHALLASEDERFYDHSGIDAEALGRVIKTLGQKGGGSTLTQQLAKMILHQGYGNFIKRGIQKVKEWIVAVKLERNFTKEEIITLYLNTAPWGNIFGIRNASLAYYQKEPKALNIEEAAVLVAMLRSTIYDPVRHPDKSLPMRNAIINNMATCELHFITQADADRLKAKPLLTNFKRVDENIGIAPYFRDVLKEKLKEWCKTHKNPKTGTNYNLMGDGLRIYTTIDSRMQQYAEEAVVKHMPVIQKKLDWNLKAYGARMWKGHENTIESAMKYTERWKNMVEDDIKPEDIKKSFYVKVKMKVFAWNANREKDTTMTPYDSIKYHKQLLQTSFAAIDPKSGEVKCWVGGIDYKWFKFDHITAKRQVGSTIKPLIYTLAVQDAGYELSTPIEGGSAKYGTGYYTGGGGNFASCLAYSKNIASIRLTNLVGVKRVIEFAHICGISVDIPVVSSVALGIPEVPMLEMLRAYTMFPNMSNNTEPILVTRIEDKAGNLLEQFQSKTKQVISEGSAYTMVKAMQGVVQFGTAKSLNSYAIPVQKAGKTGTTNNNADGWFIGYTPELLAGTWVGCEDPFLQVYSGTSGGNEMAAPKWGLFMSKVYADKKLGYGKIKEFEKPAILKNEEISADIDYGAQLFSKGNSSGGNINEDEGNGNANDFIMEDPPAGETETSSEIVPIESEIKNPPADTNTVKPKKPEDKAIVKPVSPALKPADDKTKPAKPADKTKPAGTNDY
jgi:penicillin-binding protein 1A